MYSLNAPVPGRVSRLAEELYPALSSFSRVREEHSLLVKRLGDDEGYDRVSTRVRTALAGAPAFEAAVTGIDYFAEPPTGTAPVVYLTVESPGLRALHDRLVAEFGAIDHLEGDSFVPHVTLARDGDPADAERLAERAVEPITWTVSELVFKDARHGQRIGTISLPA